MHRLYTCMCAFLEYRCCQVRVPACVALKQQIPNSKERLDLLYVPLVVGQLGVKSTCIRQILHTKSWIHIVSTIKVFQYEVDPHQFTGASPSLLRAAVTGYFRRLSTAPVVCPCIVLPSSWAFRRTGMQTIRPETMVCYVKDDGYKYRR